MMHVVARAESEAPPISRRLLHQPLVRHGVRVQPIFLLRSDVVQANCGETLASLHPALAENASVLPS